MLSFLGPDAGAAEGAGTTGLATGVDRERDGRGDEQISHSLSEGWLRKVQTGQVTSPPIDGSPLGGGCGGGVAEGVEVVEKSVELGLDDGTAELDASLETPHIWHLTILSVAPGGG